MSSTQKVDVVIVGAGAAGLMCAIEAGKRGRNVLVLDKSNKPGKKILMSGGGRCNFTNLNTSAQQFISHNPHFCKSALSRYTPYDFISLVEQHEIVYYEKKLGQLFCKEKSSQIVEMLLKQCAENRVTCLFKQDITKVTKLDISNKLDDDFIITANNNSYYCKSLVIATGGLSIPTLGASPWGYQIAEQFGLKVHPTRAGLVPLTWHIEDKERFESLSGISVDSTVSCNQQSFSENLLFTHRGLSGPAILQISSYWMPGDTIIIKLLPQIDLFQFLLAEQINNSNVTCKTLLSRLLAKRLIEIFYDLNFINKPIKQYSHSDLMQITETIQNWKVKPNATEGYRTAEVTLGGVDCDEISSKTFEAHRVKNLYFIGEVLDITGWLGGYNFQWAWSSGWAAGQVV